jgi:hypothetical protein
MKNRTLIALAIAFALTPAVFAKNGALSLIPNDAVTVGVVHLADMRTSSLSSMLFQHTDDVTAHGDAAVFLSDAGLEPSKDVDLVVVTTSPRSNLGAEASLLVAAEGRFNVDRLTTALVSRGAVKKNGYFVLPDSKNEGDRKGVVAFPDSHLALIGSEDAVTAALANYAGAGTTFLTASGLGREVARIDPKATAWAIIDVARASRIANAPHVPTRESSAALGNALKSMSTIALWATDTGDSLKLNGLGVGHDAETLQLVEDTVRGALAAMRLAVQDKSPDLVNVLRKFEVTHSTDTVAISGTIPAETLKTLMAKKHQAHATHVDGMK